MWAWPALGRTKMIEYFRGPQSGSSGMGAIRFILTWSTQLYCIHNKNGTIKKVYVEQIRKTTLHSWYLSNTSSYCLRFYITYRNISIKNLSLHCITFKIKITDLSLFIMSAVPMSHIHHYWSSRDYAFLIVACQSWDKKSLESRCVLQRTFSAFFAASPQRSFFSCNSTRLPTPPGGGLGSFLHPDSTVRGIWLMQCSR